MLREIVKDLGKLQSEILKTVYVDTSGGSLLQLNFTGGLIFRLGE